MATSGYKQVDFCSRKGANRYYLRVEWNRTSYNTTANNSTISVNLYLGSHGNGYGMNASATKTGSITINGTTYNISKAGLSLSSGGKIKIWGKTGITIGHNTDGTKSFSISASFNPAVSISGSACGTATISSTSFTLNTIPRASTISSAGNWTAGNNYSVSISRKTSAYNHKVQIYIGSTQIAERTGVGTSVTFSFSSTENQKLFANLGTSSSKTAQVRVLTMSGSTQIGDTATKDVTVSNVASSTTSYNSSVNIGSTLSGKISSKNSKFTHRVRLMRTNKTDVISTIMSNSTSSTAKSWSVTVPTSVYSLTPNSNNYTMYIEITTYWNGTTQQIGSIRTAAITAKVTGSNPTFNPTTNFTFADYNTTTAGITGNPSKYMIQGYSKLKATLAAGGLATGVNSATISKYEVTFASVTKTATHAAGTARTFDFGTVTASTSQSMKITAIDSRGNKTTRSVTVYCLPYQKPKIIPKVERVNGFTVNVTAAVSGSYSRLTIDNSDKNSVTATCTYSVDGGSYGTVNSFTLNRGTGKYNSTSTINTTLALTSVGKAKIVVTDKIGSVAVEVDISTGLPLFYVDSEMGSASFNKLPSYKSTLEMGLKLDLARNQYWGGGKASYGLNAGNSDIIHINSLVFGDYSNNLGEGLRFPNSTYTWSTDYGHTNGSVAENGQTGTALKNVYGDYTNVFFRNAEMWIDGGKFMQFVNSNYGANAWANNTINMWAQSYHLYTKDVDPSHNNGFVLDGNDGYKLHIDANEMIWTNGVQHSPNYLQASTHNIQSYTVPTSGTGEFSHTLKVSNDSNGGYTCDSAWYSRTVTNAANVYVNSNGTLFRSTSSKDAKLDIVPAFDSLEEYKKILEIEPVKWFDKFAMEANATVMTAEYEGEEIDVSGGLPNMNRVYGCVAEQLQEVGLDCLIQYDDENKEISGVAYDRIPIMYIPLFKDLYAQVESLKQEVAALKGE